MYKTEIINLSFIDFSFFGNKLSSHKLFFRKFGNLNQILGIKRNKYKILIKLI